MDETLQRLIHQAQQALPGTTAQQQAIVALVDRVLKARRVSRSTKGQPLAGIYLEIFQAAQAYLQQAIEPELQQVNLARHSASEWIAGLRTRTFQVVLSEERLQQLALAAQQAPWQTNQRQYAIQELTNAIHVSGKLARKPRLSRDLYTDVVNQTLLWVCQHIHTYNPARGTFMAWVNYRLEMIGRSIQQEQKDPYTQSTQQKIMRLKLQFRVWLKQSDLTQVQTWLILYLKRLIPNLDISLNVLFYLVVLVIFSILLHTHSSLSDSLLYEMAKGSILLPPEITNIEEMQTIEAVAQPQPEPPSLMEHVQEYIQVDPKGLGQKHIRDHPEATFQAIALARINGKSWQELSDRYGIKIAALSNFYQRTLKQLAAEIRSYVQEQS